jgi:hypothetical protein
VEVTAVASPPPPNPVITPPATPPPGELPATGGGNLARSIGFAAALLVAGVFGDLTRRRRRRSP